MVDENTVRFGTNVDKDEDMRKATADSHPGIRELTRGRKPGDELARADLDPYYRSFRNATTHILARELTESAVRSALQSGHAFVSHDWMCEATGFSVILQSAESSTSGKAVPAMMGDEVKFTTVKGGKLLAHFPVSCHARLLRDGKVTAETDHDQFEYTVENPGVY